MTDRARLYTLFARREASRTAELGRSVLAARAEQTAAQATGDKLDDLARAISPQGGAMNAASLRAIGLLMSDLAAEADRQRLRAEHAGANAERLRQLIVTHDRRRQFGETAATAARIEAAEAAAARAEAAVPQTRRGG